MSSANPQSAVGLESFSYSLPNELQNAVSDAQKKWDQSGNTERLWKKDASLWTNTDESKWLGWLDIVDQELGNVSRFKALQAEIREDGFTHVLLLGMGGSSLCPEVFSKTFGKQPDSPELLVLDSTGLCATALILLERFSAFRANRVRRWNRTSICSTSMRRPERLWAIAQGITLSPSPIPAPN
jgi:hypothetical protein